MLIDVPLDERKTKLLDVVACSASSTLSFADVGATWKVNGGYAEYLTCNYSISRAVLIDVNITTELVDRARAIDAVVLGGRCTQADVIQALGYVDFVILFDFLLHQVDPDWKEVLRSLSRCTNTFVIFHPSWIGSKASIRLLDLALEDYFSNVPHNRSDAVYCGVYEELASSRSRLDIWQWGITSSDLIDVMHELGFYKSYQIGYESALGLKNFVYDGFVFVRSDNKET